MVQPSYIANTKDEKKANKIEKQRTIKQIQDQVKHRASANPNYEGY